MQEDGVNGKQKNGLSNYCAPTPRNTGLWSLNQIWLEDNKKGMSTECVSELQQVSVAKNVLRVHILLHRLEHAEPHAGHALFHPFLPQFSHCEREREREREIEQTCASGCKRWMMDVVGWVALLKRWDVLHDVIYGEQQTIKLIMLPVLPAEREKNSSSLCLSVGLLLSFSD